MIRIPVLTASLFALLHVPVGGQSFQTDILNMHAAFWNAYSFYTEMEIRIYDAGRDGTPDEVTKAVIQKKDHAFYYAWEGKELLFQNEFALLVSHEMKTMTMYEMNQERRFSPDLMMHRVTGLLEEYKEEVRELGDVEDGRCYMVEPRKSWVTRIEWCIDPATGWLNGMDYMFRDRGGSEGRVETLFFNTCLDGEIPEAVFRPGHFILKTENGWQPAENYNDYQLIIPG